MSKTIVHVKHFSDGYPLCWPMDKDGPFCAISDEKKVTCKDCLDILNEPPYNGGGD